MASALCLLELRARRLPLASPSRRCRPLLATTVRGDDWSGYSGNPWTQMTCMRTSLELLIHGGASGYIANHAHSCVFTAGGAAPQCYRASNAAFKVSDKRYNPT
ncbi:hypothetical protein SORBI_3002G387701 [Sorghum bicolor]|uniref:Uncharacterized protein n=1 Tax=Sorghum bicolor TaxID=4558 RepID=A0A1B6QFT9_SORBI|nr:hypothetical protein SORBI_3002G387701 [Sorghum bicolor]